MTVEEGSAVFIILVGFVGLCMVVYGIIQLLKE